MDIEKVKKLVNDAACLTNDPSVEALLAVALNEMEQKDPGCMHEDSVEVTAMGAKARQFICKDCGARYEVAWPVKESGANGG